MPHGKPDFSALDGVPVQGHFGTADEFVSVEDAKALEQELNQAGAEAAFEFYEGAGHAFFNDTDRLGTHHEGHAKQAWDRTVDFFKRHLGGGARGLGAHCAAAARLGRQRDARLECVSASDDICRTFRTSDPRR